MTLHHLTEDDPMNLETVEFTLTDGVATIALNRPNAANAIDVQLAKDLFAAASHCDGNPAVRAVILTGKGKMFSGGGDVPGFVSAGAGAPNMLRNITAPLHAAISLLARMNAPVIVAVNGTAAGAGFSIALSGDIVLAAASAKFTMAYTRIGVSPDGGGTFFLPRLVGTLRAKELIFMNPLLTAEDALAKGLVTAVIPDAELMSHANGLALQLAAGPTAAYGEVKRLIADSHSNSLETQMGLEARAIAGLAAATSDAREGFTAFVGKRKAVFEGR
jgi:2-(1,2-epoxy-1,2-dihydrophenyl)acetyl-CoA isomerase